MRYEKSSMFDAEYMKENMMGPNCVKILEEMMAQTAIKPGMRVLDIGCGKGLTSIFLAREFGVTVFATDLWISATENYERFEAMGLGDAVIPIHADALALPYADGFFDAAVSVDAYFYFGGEDAGYMDRCLAPMVKPGGPIIIGIPGIKTDLPGLPDEMVGSVSAEDFATFRSTRWWTQYFAASRLFETERIWEFSGFSEAWSDWLQCDDNPYAVSDRAMLRADGGRFMNIICAIGRRV